MFDLTRLNSLAKFIPISLALGLIVISSLVPSRRSVAQGVPPPPPDDAPVEPFTEQQPRSEHLDNTLDTLNVSWEEAQRVGTDFDVPSAANQLGGLQFIDDRVFVEMVMLDEQAADNAINSLPAYGAEMSAHYKRWINAWVPISELDRVSELPGVSIIRPPFPMEYSDDVPAAPIIAPLQTGPVNSEGVNPSGANDWHNQGHIGSGIKVAVIDSFQNYDSARAAGELPFPIIYNTLDMSDPHGTGVAEVIYDMAPGAQLTFASANDSISTANAIRGLALAGNKIINASWMRFDAGPGDGTGPLADAISDARAYGALFVNSAGNFGTTHFDGQFKDDDNDSYMEFTGADEVNEFFVGSDKKLRIYLRWNDWPGSNQNFNLFLMRYNWSTQSYSVVDYSTVSQTGSQEPIEFIDYDAQGGYWYAIRISGINITEEHQMDLYIGGPHSSSILLSTRTVEQSILHPADAPNAFVVGAIDHQSFVIKDLSSNGPCRGLGGSDWPAVCWRPHISAYSCVSTSVHSYGPGGFCGTSAAAPHVAGAAALVFGRFPGYTPAQVQQYLEEHALHPSGLDTYDFAYGHGRLHLPEYPFADVPVAGKEWMADYIEPMYSDSAPFKILVACDFLPSGEPEFCPEDPLTRDYMAVWLLRAIYYPTPIAPADIYPNLFSDVPIPGREWTEPFIEQFYQLGITTGCDINPPRYCPGNYVTRAAMAVFLLRAKYGSFYQPPPATGIFDDLPVAGKEWMEPWVEQFYNEGYTTGCAINPLRYCPESYTTRAAAAAFINRVFNSIPPNP